MAAVVMALQTTASRNVAPRQMAVMAAGSNLFIRHGDTASGEYGARMAHNPNYDIEDPNIPEGSAFGVEPTERFLA